MSRDQSSLETVLGRRVSRETLERLVHLSGELARWTRQINLIGKSSIPDLWARHILDSAQLIPAAPDTGHWTDLGSGGGLPGLVVACLRPGAPTTLVESDQRKAAFLQTMAFQLDLTVDIQMCRIEATPPLNTQILSARALAPLDTLLGYAERHLAQNGVALFPKGKSHGDEVRTALASWRFQVETLPSKTNTEAVILRIKDIARA